MSLAFKALTRAIKSLEGLPNVDHWIIDCCKYVFLLRDSYEIIDFNDNVQLIIEFWIPVLLLAFKGFNRCEVNNRVTKCWFKTFDWDYYMFILVGIFNRVYRTFFRRKYISDLVIYWLFKCWDNWIHQISHIKRYQILTIMLLIAMHINFQRDIYLFVLLLFYDPQTSNLETIWKCRINYTQYLYV